MDIERKCKFNRITTETIITYKFAATMNDKKARAKFIKGPFKIQLVLENIEIVNYNGKYGNRRSNHNRRKQSSDSSSDGEQIAYTKQIRKMRTNDTGKKNQSGRSCHVWGKLNWTLEHSCSARKAQCNNYKIMGHFAKVCRSKTVNHIREEEEETDSDTERWPEIDHIQSVNCVNRVDFYEAILLVEGQPIEHIIDTGSPVTIIPPVITTKDLNETAKCFVDVNKNPIKFKGEAKVEVLMTESKNHNQY